MEVEIRPYRPTTERVKLRSWLQVRQLTHFRAEAHIIDGLAYVEIDFAYGGPMWCIKVFAEQPSDVAFTVLNEDTEEWDVCRAADAIYGDGNYSRPLTLGDLEPLARAFAAMHFWNDEGV